MGDINVTYAEDPAKRISKLLDAMRPKIERRCRYLLKRWFGKRGLQEVEDSTQKAVIFIYSELSSTMSESDIQKLAYRSVMRACSNALPRRKRKVQSLENAGQLNAASPDPSAELQLLQTREQVRNALVTLRDSLRLPIEMYFFDGKTKHEICASLQLSENAVNVRTSIGYRLLRAKLGNIEC